MSRVAAVRRISRWLGRLARARDAEAGQAMVEFALVFPLLLVFLLGAIEFGYAALAYNRVSHAAQEGARYGMALTRTSGAFATSGNIDGTYTPLAGCSGTPTTIVATVACQIAPLDRNRVTVVLDTPTGTAGGTVIPNLSVQVTVRYAYQPLTPLFPFVSGLVLPATAVTLTQ